MDIITDNVDAARGPAASDSAQKAKNGDVAPASLTQVVPWRTPVLTVPKAAAQSRNPSLPTFVGLIILILTFFIVLTSISLHDQKKSKAAIASLQKAFSGNAVTTETEDAKDDQEVARDYIAGLSDRIQSLVPLMGGKPAPASDRQVLWLPVDLAFSPGSDALAPLFPKVLREVVDSLDGVPRRFSPRIEMRLCANGASEQLRTRAVAVSTALLSEHAPAQQFAIGVMACDPKYVGIAIALAPTSEEAAQ